MFISAFAALMSTCSDDQPAVTPDPKPEPGITETPEEEEEPEVSSKGEMLGGKIIGSQWSVDYNNNNAKTDKVNTKANAFDGDFDTYFAS